jgi:hypothetical protein
MHQATFETLPASGMFTGRWRHATPAAAKSREHDRIFFE